MNKKNAVFAAILLSFSHIVLPLPQLSRDQEKVRLATLWNLHNYNAFTTAQFVEDGYSIGAIINRDIALLEKDSERILKQNDFLKGFFRSRMIPGICNGIAIAAGIGSLMNLSASFIYYAEGNNILTKAGIYPTTTDYLNKVERLKGSYSDGDLNKKILEGYDNAGSSFISSLIEAGISIYAIRKSASWGKKNIDLIQNAEANLSRNQAIIAQLKQLKYDNGL